MSLLKITFLNQNFSTTSLNRFVSWRSFFEGLLFCFCFCGLFRPAPMACGDSQARGWIGAVAACLCHSHSTARSKPGLQPTPQLTATLDLSCIFNLHRILNPLSQGSNPCLHRYYGVFLTCWATMRTPIPAFLLLCSISSGILKF